VNKLKPKPQPPENHPFMPPQKIEEHRHAFAAGNDLGNDRVQAVKDPARNGDRVADGRRLRHDMQFIRSEQPMQPGHHVVRDGWPAVAKMNHSGHAGRVVDAAQLGLPLEAGEKVIREQRFGDPDGPAPGFSAETEARQENLDAGNLPQVARRQMFVFGPGAQAEPGEAGSGSGTDSSPAYAHAHACVGTVIV
jgi:hypothetical protein